MEKRYGFLKMNIAEFDAWIQSIRIARTVLTIQQHHTFIPAYSQFTGSNHFQLQRFIKNYHVRHNGWGDIAQHFTSFPDGSILTGRSLERSPACISGQNANSICIEHLGNFDLERDIMTPEHSDCIVRMTGLLCQRFGLQLNTNTVVYHHWFDLISGRRNDGKGNNKSCPGTNFFGGNKVHHCEESFLPLIQPFVEQKLLKSSQLLKYVSVTATKLNLRTAADANAPKVLGREAALFGAVLRVYQEKNGWYKISESQEHWVYSVHTRQIRRAVVNRKTADVRIGPGKNFDRIGSFHKGHELFISEEVEGWSKVDGDDKWINNKYLTFL